MNGTTRLRIRRELARAMWPTAEITESPYSKYKIDIRVYDKPSETRTWYNFDPFTNHGDCAALVEWLFNQRSVNPLAVDSFECFLRDLLVAPKFLTYFHALDYLTSPLETRVLAACAALGISTGDE